jgi:DNA-directed RNA polymerase specialized sigma24 family protein
MSSGRVKEMSAKSELAIRSDAIDAAPLDAGMLRVLMAAAAYQARRVARTLKLSDVEREDAEQEILLALLERRRFFDPARGPWSPFVHRIARQAAQSVADSLVATRKLYTSLEEPIAEASPESEATTLADTLQDPAAPAEEDIVDTVSLMSFVATLPSELRIVAEAALEADGELADAQRELGLSISEFYRRLREIRYRLFTIGLVERRRLLDP